jgi:hypothetical protein
MPGGCRCRCGLLRHKTLTPNSRGSAGRAWRAFRLLLSRVLPPLHDHIGVKRVQVHQEAIRASKTTTRSRPRSSEPNRVCGRFLAALPLYVLEHRLIRRCDPLLFAIPPRFHAPSRLQQLVHPLFRRSQRFEYGCVVSKDRCHGVAKDAPAAAPSWIAGVLSRKSQLVHGD